MSIVRKIRVVVVGLVAAACLSRGAMPAAGGEAAGQTPATAAKAPELFKLKNEELLKQARALYSKVEGEYRAQLRELAVAELALADIRRQNAGWAVPAAPATAETIPPKMAVESAKMRQAALTGKLKLAHAQKADLDRVAAACASCQTAETTYLNALEDLRGYVVESGLRVQDETLALDQVPRELSSGLLEKRRAELEADAVARQKRTAALVTAQDATRQMVEDAAKTLLAADAELTQASNALAQEDKSQEMRKQYAGKPPAELARELNALAEEGIGLKGTFELGLARFNAAASEADRLRQMLESSKPPEGKIPQLTQPEAVELAASGMQQLIDFYAGRSKALAGLGAALAELIRIGTEFNADATVSSEHLFKMRIIAEVLKQSGVSGLILIHEAELPRVLAVAQRESQQVAAVQAAMERAKTERPLADKQQAETRANADMAAGQLACLRQSQTATLVALAWEGKLKGMTPDQAIAAFNAAGKALQKKLAAIAQQRGEYKAALNGAMDWLAKLDMLKDPLLRVAEESLQSQQAQILAGLRKDAGLERAVAAPAANSAGTTGTTGATVVAKIPASEAKTLALMEQKPEPSELGKATTNLVAFQQLVSGRLRVMEERDRLDADLLAAITGMKKVGAAYGQSLAEARQLAIQWSTSAVDLKKRIGKGEVSGEKAPAELAQALRPEVPARLDAEVAALLATESQFRQQQETLQKLDAAGAASKALTTEVLALVGQRLDLLADLRQLDAACKLAGKDRDPSEVKRLEQEATERQDGESSIADALLSIDTSKRAKGLRDLLESDYRELVDLEYKEDNLRQQREKAGQLIELAQKEQPAIAKVLPVLEKQVVAVEVARDEEAVLAQARLKPEQADELLKAFRARTGRLLSKPVPLAEQDKAAKVAELAKDLFEKTVQVTAMQNWYAALATRLAPGGIMAEAGVYQDEAAKMNAASGANDRRIEALTGQKPPAPGSKESAVIHARQKFAGTGGLIAGTRHELVAVRKYGVLLIGLKILSILVGTVLLPRLLRPLIRRAVVRGARADDTHGNLTLLLNTLQLFVKTAVWIAALAMILSVLGFDVTAIVAGLGIGGLAFGLAAQPVLADLISALIIFAERKFTIGDVIKIGDNEPAKVVGLSWRGTQLKGWDGQVVNVPNRNITSATVRNLTKEGRTFDSVSINITTQKDVPAVLALIKKAAAECQHLTGEGGYAIAEYQHKGDSRTIKYQFWWYLSDYELRNKTRAEVFAHISANLESENMADTEVTLA